VAGAFAAMPPLAAGDYQCVAQVYTHRDLRALESSLAEMRLRVNADSSLFMGPVSDDSLHWTWVQDRWVLRASATEMGELYAPVLDTLRAEAPLAGVGDLRVLEMRAYDGSRLVDGMRLYVVPLASTPAAALQVGSYAGYAQDYRTGDSTEADIALQPARLRMAKPRSFTLSAGGTYQFELQGERWLGKDSSGAAIEALVLARDKALVVKVLRNRADSIEMLHRYFFTRVRPGK